jgi:hypothetical protein
LLIADDVWTPDYQADVRFPSVQWNELVQGLSSMAVYEFQGWARAATFVKTPGAYVISCAGTKSIDPCAFIVVFTERFRCFFFYTLRLAQVRTRCMCATTT